jgi:hypothetical protein
MGNMHSTLKAETARAPRTSLRAQPRRVQAFRHEYSHERPHEALADATPASREPSSRAILISYRTRSIRHCFASNGCTPTASSRGGHAAGEVVFGLTDTDNANEAFGRERRWKSSIQTPTALGTLVMPTTVAAARWACDGQWRQGIQ